MDDKFRPALLDRGNVISYCWLCIGCKTSGSETAAYHSACHFDWRLYVCKLTVNSVTSCLQRPDLNTAPCYNKWHRIHSSIASLSLTWKGGSHFYIYSCKYSTKRISLKSSSYCDSFLKMSRELETIYVLRHIVFE